MRIAIITTSYLAFLRQLYSKVAGLEARSYLEQLAARNESLFGFADFYSRGFKAHGHEAVEFHLNNPWLQYAWAREHGVAVPQPRAPDVQPAHASRTRLLLAPLRPLLRPVVRRLVEPRPPSCQIEILRAQIEAFQPDILYNQEPSVLRSGLLKTFQAPGRKIVGQIASALPAGEDFRGYDLMVSSLPNFVARFRKNGVPAAFNRLAFETSVFDRVDKPPVRDIPVSFVGNLSPDHPERLALLERVAERLPLAMWGSGIEHLSPASPLRKCYRGEAWGRTMHEVLGRSRVTLNLHANFSGAHANNLRLYEATGMGATLLTDRKSDLGDIFAPGEEVATYESPEDCASQVERLLADDGRRESIAAAGQRRTFASHNYFNRTGELLGLFQDVLNGTARRR
jgi:spore maturation protein CgeB